MYCARETICDGLVDGDGPGVAVMGRAGWVLVSVLTLALSLSLFSLSLPVSDSLLLLEESGAVPLLLHFDRGLYLSGSCREKAWWRSSSGMPQSDCGRSVFALRFDDRHKIRIRESPTAQVVVVAYQQAWNWELEGCEERAAGARPGGDSQLSR